MAQETPSNPNVGGTGNKSSDYSEIRAPQFVGGNTDPNTGNIIPASASSAAVAPPPQQPTTLLANVDVPQCAVAYPIVTELHLMVLATHIAADVAETDEDTGAVARLAELNANVDRNRCLAKVEGRLGEELSVDDLAKMKTAISVDYRARLDNYGRNSSMFPKNILVEITSASAISPASK